MKNSGFMDNSIIDIIKSACKLDPLDCNYSFLNEEMGPILVKDKGIERRGLFINVLIYFGKIFREIKNIFGYKKILGKSNELITFISSQNQKQIYNNLNLDSDLYEIRTGKKNFPLIFSYLLSLIFIPIVAYKYYRIGNSYKKRYLNKLDYNIYLYGHYVVCRLLFRGYKKILLMNDHEMWSRVAKKAAEDEGLLTIYIPHASVNDKFPKLDFDHAFLDGHHSFDIYKNIGIKKKSRIHVIGSAKYDDILYSNEAETKKSLLICVNLKDNMQKVEEFLSDIREGYDRIIIRPHPSDNRDWRKVVKSSPNIELSIEKSIIDDLKKVKTQLAGESNVHLDAEYLGIRSFYKNFTDGEVTDHYGFLENNLITKYNPSSSNGKVNNKAIKYYIHNYGEAYDGKVGNIINKIIHNI